MVKEIQHTVDFNRSRRDRILVVVEKKKEQTECAVGTQCG